MSEIGHNATDGQLRALVERIERLEIEKRERAEDIREVYSEAKANGYDAPAIRALIRERAQDAQKRERLAELLDLYRSAVGAAP